jgi:glycosyltransferase involved in cell wall biosynthesis
MKRLAIITTHPIQYYAPLFNILSSRKNIAVKVFYSKDKEQTEYDKDFGQTVKWDIPLLEGYEHRFVPHKVPSGLIREIEDWGTDAVLVIGWNHLSHLRSILHFKDRIPVLFRGDSTLLDERSGIKKWARHSFLRWLYSYIDTALYVGTNNKDYFLVNGLQEGQLVFAPHAIDNGRFYDQNGKHEEKARQWKKEMGIEGKATSFVFVGKFQEKKDPLLLIQAFNRLNDANAHLIMAGNGELELILKDAAATNKNIHFLPFQNQSAMPVVYRLGDIFCLPSKGPEETWGLAVNEAMACDRPILVSDRCGCAVDLVKEGQNGYIFASGKLDDLTGKMKAFLQDTDVLKDMGVASGTIIRSWSYDQLAPAIENAISDRNGKK